MIVQQPQRISNFASKFIRVHAVVLTGKFGVNYSQGEYKEMYWDASLMTPGANR